MPRWKLETGNWKLESHTHTRTPSRRPWPYFGQAALPEWASEESVVSDGALPCVPQTESQAIRLARAGTS